MAVFKDSYTNSWACKFRYTDFNGISKQKKKTGFVTKREANEYESSFKEKYTGTSDITFSGLADYYLKDCEARLKPATYVGKCDLFKTHFIPAFGNVKISDITPVMVRSWQTKMINSGKYTPTFLNRLHAQLSAVFNFAVNVYGLKVNPCHGAGSMGKPKANRIDYWTPEEFNRFISVVKKPIAKVGFTLLFYSGMRVGELCALTLADFDFNANTVRINKNYVRFDKTDIIQDTPKTAKSVRTIEIPASVMGMVRSYARNQQVFDFGGRLFPMTQHYFRNEINKGCDRSGVRKIRVHDIRHSHASMLMNLGTPIKQISERLGHENIETTLSTYAHLYKDKEKETVQKLDEIASKMAI